MLVVCELEGFMQEDVNIAESEYVKINDQCGVYVRQRRKVTENNVVISEAECRKGPDPRSQHCSRR